MAEQIDRKARILLLHIEHHLLQVIADSAHLVGAEVAEASLLGDAAAVSAMVVHLAHITVLGKILHKRIVTLLVLSHTVREHNDSLGLTHRLDNSHRQRMLVDIGRNNLGLHRKIRQHCQRIKRSRSLLGTHLHLLISRIRRKHAQRSNK